VRIIFAAFTWDKELAQYIAADKIVFALAARYIILKKSVQQFIVNAATFYLSAITLST